MNAQKYRKRCSYVVGKMENWRDVIISMRNKRVQSDKTQKREFHKMYTISLHHACKTIIGFANLSVDIGRYRLLNKQCRKLAFLKIGLPPQS